MRTLTHADELVTKNGSDSGDLAQMREIASDLPDNSISYTPPSHRGEGAREPGLPPHSGEATTTGRRRGQSPTLRAVAPAQRAVTRWGKRQQVRESLSDRCFDGVGENATGSLAPIEVPVEGGTVVLQGLRSAIDWATVRCPRGVGRELPADVLLLPSWEASDAAEPRWTLPLVCSSREGSWAARGPGLYLLVDGHGVEIQVQGAVLARVRSGGEALVLDVLRAALGWLYGHQLTAYEADDPLTVLGSELSLKRLDVAHDVTVAHRADDGAVTAGDAWLDEALWGSGSAVSAAGFWSTRAKRHETVCEDGDDLCDPPLVVRAGDPRVVRLLGRFGATHKPRVPEAAYDLPKPSRPGRTLYLGTKAGCQVCVYEKDLAPRAKTSTMLALQTLTHCGWDRIARVIRVEYRLGAAWWRDQVITLRDGRTPRASTLSAVELLAHLPQIVAEVAQRQRHTDHTDDARRDRRRSSALQTVIESLTTRWADETGATDLDAVVSSRRESMLQRQRRSGALVVARLVGATGADPAAVTGGILSEYLRLTAGDARTRSPEDKVFGNRVLKTRDRYEVLYGKGKGDLVNEHIIRYESAASRPELVRLHVEARTWAVAQAESSREGSGPSVIEALDAAYRGARERLAA
jgi:hypothetical protein